MSNSPMLVDRHIVLDYKYSGHSNYLLLIWCCLSKILWVCQKSGAVQENLSQSSNGSWWERGGVREHRGKSGAASLSYIFNNILLLERKMRLLFGFFLQRFLPLWLPPSCSVGCWFGCRTWPLYHQLTLVQFLMINSILMVLVFLKMI